MNFCPSQLETFYHGYEKTKHGKTIPKNMS